MVSNLRWEWKGDIKPDGWFGAIASTILFPNIFITCVSIHTSKISQNAEYIYSGEEELREIQVNRIPETYMAENICAR